MDFKTKLWWLLDCCLITIPNLDTVQIFHLLASHNQKEAFLHIPYGMGRVTYLWSVMVLLSSFLICFILLKPLSASQLVTGRTAMISKSVAMFSRFS